MKRIILEIDDIMNNFKLDELYKIIKAGQMWQPIELETAINLMDKHPIQEIERIYKWAEHTYNSLDFIEYITEQNNKSKL